MRSLGIRLTILALGTYMCGCSPSPEPTPETISWQASGSPVLDISDWGREGDVAIQFARDAVRLPNGTLVVVDQYAATLLFFDRNGDLVRSAGTRGQGPGEFADVRWVDHCGTDSLYVWDYLRRTVSVRDSTGVFVREFRPEGNPHEFTCNRNGVFAVIGLPSEYTQPNTDGTRDPAPIFLMDAEGQIGQRFDDVPFGENRALGKLARIALGPSHLFIGPADSAWVDILGLDGQAQGGVRLGGPPRSPTPANYSAAIEGMLSIVSDARVRDRFREEYAALALPELVPPYVDLMVDPLGMLWAVASVPGDPETVLHGTNMESGLQARVVLPGGIQVFEVGEDFVLGVLSDEEGNQHIVEYGLHRQP